MQTSGVFDGYTAGNIGPEPGVTYQIRFHWVDPDSDSTLEPAAAIIDAGQATSWGLVDADYPEPPIGVEMAAIRVRAVRGGYEDRAFREYRVQIGGKVHLTRQELTVVFTGPTVDVTAQAAILDLRPPETGVLFQELIIELLP